MFLGRKRRGASYLGPQSSFKRTFDPAVLSPDINESVQLMRSIIVELIQIDYKRIESGIYAGEHKRLKEKHAWVFRVTSSRKVLKI